MNELTGRHVNVVLAVEEGRGMEFLGHPVNIAATFNGRLLESDYVPAEERPAFNTELVWETEKRDLRRVRSANSPLRVECWTVDSFQKRDRVGFAMLSLRSANIMPLAAAGRKAVEVPFRWQKLVGIPSEFRGRRPELYISLSIRDYRLNQEPDSAGVEVSLTEPPAEENDTECYDEEESQVDDAPVAAVAAKKTIPVRYLPDGHIQIGDGRDVSVPYAFTVAVREAANLDVLLPEVLVFNHQRRRPSTDGYHVSFSMFGIAIRSRPFRDDLHDRVALDERIVVRLVSSATTLREFFAENENVAAYFHSGSDKLGKALINVQDLMQSGDSGDEDDEEDDEEYGDEEEGGEGELRRRRPPARALRERCYFSFPSPNGIVPEGPEGRKPYIDVEVGLRRLGGSRSNGDAAGESGAGGRRTIKTVKSPLEKSPSASGDHGEAADAGAPPATEAQEITDADADADAAAVAILKPRPKSAIVDAQRDFYRRYALEVVLQSVLWKKAIKSRHVLVKFRHPRAATYVTTPFETDGGGAAAEATEELRCRVHFVARPDQIRPMIYAWPPKVVITDEKDQNVSEETDLYTAMFLAKDKLKCSYAADLKAFRTFEPVAKVNISMYLSESALDRPAPPAASCDLLPPLLDESITVEQLRDVQAWKEEQMRVFRDDLRRLEAKRMTELRVEWHRRKEALEAKLSKSVLRCKELSDELQAAASALKRQKQPELRRVPSDAPAGLLELFDRLREENARLKKIADEQNDEIQQQRKCALTREQTAGLLQELRVLEEKFSDAQRAKSYFKEQWKCAVREIHELRSEDQKQLKTQIMRNREALSHLSLDEFLSKGGDAGGEEERDCDEMSV